MEQYYIESGVHRCVAARQVGLEEVPATLHVEDKPDERVVVRLDQLHTKRATVFGHKTRRRDLPGLIEAMRDDTRRMRIPVIELQVLGAFGQPKTIPLLDVQITDHEEDVR